MPLPEKQHDETREQFIDRCMADPTMVREFPDAPQRRAVCEKQADRPATANAGTALQLISEPGAMTIEASAGGAAPDGDGKPRLPRFSMVAYTGGPMRIAGWRYPVVVDLAGLGIPSQARPIRFGHDATAGVGHTDAIRVEDGRLVAAGVVSRDTPVAKEVVASAKNGFPWQASIGASVDQFEFVREDRTVLVNGREFKGPVNVVRRATLGEISFVDIGADGDTSASVAATANRRTIMNDTEVKQEQAKVEAAAARTDGAGKEGDPKRDGSRLGTPAAPPVADTADDIRAKAVAETTRIDAIRRVCAARHADIEVKAIGEGWDVTKTELEVLRAERPKAPAVTVGAEHWPVRAIEAGLCLRATKDEKFVEAQYGRDYLDGARRYRRMGLVQAAAMCLRADGLEVDFDNAAVVKAALSTTSFPVLLSNIANKTLLKSYNDFPATALRWCAQGDLPDFKGQTRARLNLAGGLQEIGPDGRGRVGDRPAQDPGPGVQYPPMGHHQRRPGRADAASHGLRRDLPAEDRRPGLHQAAGQQALRRRD